MKGVGVLLVLAGCVAGAAFGQAPPPSGPVHVTVCELIAAPDAFRNRRVEVAGTIISDTDVLALRDEPCVSGRPYAPSIWLTAEAQGPIRYSPNWTPEAYAKARREARIHSASANVTWVEPVPVSRPPASELDALHTAIRKSEGRPVRAVVVGRFDSSTGGLLAEAADGHMRWAPGFGHLGGYSCQIVIESIRVVPGE